MQLLDRGFRASAPLTGKARDDRVAGRLPAPPHRWRSSRSRCSRALIVFAITQLTGSDAAEPARRRRRGRARGDPDAASRCRAPARRARRSSPTSASSPTTARRRTAARRARDRLAGADDAQARTAGQALRAQVAAGAAGDGADRGRRRRPSRAGRPLQPAPVRLGDPPLPEGGAQGQEPADPRHPARPLGLLHRDQAAAQVAQGARRRARAGPRVADVGRARSRARSSAASARARSTPPPPGWTSW